MATCLKTSIIAVIAIVCAASVTAINIVKLSDVEYLSTSEYDDSATSRLRLLSILSAAVITVFNGIGKLTVMQLRKHVQYETFQDEVKDSVNTLVILKFINCGIVPLFAFTIAQMKLEGDFRIGLYQTGRLVEEGARTPLVDRRRADRARDRSRKRYRSCVGFSGWPGGVLKATL